MVSVPQVDSRAWVMLGLLLAVDVLLVATHVLRGLHVSFDIFGRAFHLADWPKLRLGMDHGAAEVWEGVKGTATAGLFVLCFRLRRQPAYLALSAIFALPFVDNLFVLHEWGGGLLASDVLHASGLLTTALTEFAAFLVLGVVAVFVLGLAYVHSDARARAITLVGGAIMALLAVFAVGVDLLHDVALLLNATKGLDSVLALIEETGELTTVSLGLAFAYTVLRDQSSETGS